VSDETYSRVGSRIWLEHWDDDTMLTALYLLTCKHRPTEGIYHLPLQYGATDKRWPLKRFVKAFDTLLADGFVEHDPKSDVVLIVKALKWQAPANPNQMKGAVKKLKQLPPTHLLKRFEALCRLHAPAFANYIDDHCPEAFSNGV
jgi:hypothetical protein